LRTTVTAHGAGRHCRVDCHHLHSRYFLPLWIRRSRPVLASHHFDRSACAPHGPVCHSSLRNGSDDPRYLDLLYSFASTRIVQSVVGHTLLLACCHPHLAHDAETYTTGAGNPRGGAHRGTAAKRVHPTQLL